MSNELGINSSEFDGVAVDMDSERATMAKVRLQALCIALNVLAVEHKTGLRYVYKQVSPFRFQLLTSNRNELASDGIKVVYERSTMEELVYTIETVLGVDISDFRDYEGDAV